MTRPATTPWRAALIGVALLLFFMSGMGVSSIWADEDTGDGASPAPAAPKDGKAESLDKAPAPRPANAGERGPFQNVWVIDFEGEVEPMLRTYLKRRIERAQKDGADCIIFRIDSPGGQLFTAREIGDSILAIPDTIHTVAWVPEMALSAAAYISLACDEVIMGRPASLGDSQPIHGGGGEIKPAGEKIESPLRSWFRIYAQTNDYPVLLAEAMVSSHLEVIRVKSVADGRMFFVAASTYRDAEPNDLVVPQAELRKEQVVQVGNAIVTNEQLLTLTAGEALEYGFLKRSFPNRFPADEDEVLAALKAPGGKVTKTAMTFSEKAGRWLLAIAGILSAIVALSILLFFWQGPGLATIVGLSALVVMGLIYGTVDHLHGFPLFLILLGVALLAVEVLLIPGFGIPGILGIAGMASGFLLLASGATLGSTDQRVTQEGVVSFGLQFVFTAIAGLVTLIFMSRFLPSIGPGRAMVLNAPAPDSDHGTRMDEAPRPVVGTAGTTTTTLRPSGRATLDGRDVDVVSDGDFIDAGTAVRVIDVAGLIVTVRPEDA